MYKTLKQKHLKTCMFAYDSGYGPGMSRTQSHYILARLIFGILLIAGRDCWSHFSSTIQNCITSWRPNDCGSM